MKEHSLERIDDGLGWSKWKCKKCGMIATRLMGRFLKWSQEECLIE